MDGFSHWSFNISTTWTHRWKKQNYNKFVLVADSKSCRASLRLKDLFIFLGVHEELRQKWASFKSVTGLHLSQITNQSEGENASCSATWWGEMAAMMSRQIGCICLVSYMLYSISMSHNPVVCLFSVCTKSTPESTWKRQSGALVWALSELQWQHFDHQDEGSGRKFQRVQLP